MNVARGMMLIKYKRMCVNSTGFFMSMILNKFKILKILYHTENSTKYIGMNVKKEIGAI